MPATATKTIDSYNMVEEPSVRKSNNSVALGELYRSKNITENNFFKVQDQKNEHGNQSAKSEMQKDKLPNAMQKLLDQTQGSF